MSNQECIKPKLPDGLLLTAYLSAAERKAWEIRLEEGWLEFLGEDRFEAYQSAFTPPAWLAKLPRLPDRDKNGLLPV